MKNTTRNIAFILVLMTFSLSSCKKDTLPVPESNEPVFTLTGTMGGTAINMVAGDDDMYMYTMTELEYGVPVFTGNLSDGSFSVEMGIYNGYVDIPNFQPVDGLTNVNPIFSSMSLQPLTILSKNAMVNSSNILEVEWIVDGTLEGINDFPIWEPGVYYVCANVTFNDMSTATICEDLILGYNHNANFSLNFSPSGNNWLTAYVFNTSGGGNPPTIISRSWWLDGNYVGDAVQFSDSLSANDHTIEVEAHFSNGVVRRKMINADMGLTSMHHLYGLGNFETNAVATSISQDFNFKLKVLKDGIYYYSKFADNANSSINLLGLEYYGKNNDNKDVYKITLNIDAQISEGVGTVAVPINFTTTFGFEIEP